LVKHKGKKSFKMKGVAGIAILAVLVVGGIVIYKKMKKKTVAVAPVAPASAVVPSDGPVAAAMANRATYYNPYSYNSRSALMASISPLYGHKGYFSAPQHSVGNHNVIPAFSFDRDDE